MLLIRYYKSIYSYKFNSTSFITVIDTTKELLTFPSEDPLACDNYNDYAFVFIDKLSCDTSLKYYKITKMLLISSLEKTKDFVLCEKSYNERIQKLYEDLYDKYISNFLCRYKFLNNIIISYDIKYKNYRSFFFLVLYHDYLLNNQLSNNYNEDDIKNVVILPSEIIYFMKRYFI